MRNIVIASWAAGLLAGTACAQGGASSPVGFEPALARCFAAQHAAAPFSGIVLASRGDARFSRLEGTMDGTAAHDPTRPYRLASVGKVLTQVAIARLIDQGRVRLDAPISTYLRGLPAAMGAVTVEQLLRHQSGVAPMLMMTPAMIEARRTARTATDLLPLVTGAPLAFAPGSQTQYSNGGYFVLGAIVEAVSGVSYAEFLRRDVLAPLGMTATALSGDGRTAPAMTRMAGPGAPPLPAPAPSSFPELPGTPAGDAVSTAGDLLRLAQALSGSRFLADATKAAVFPRRGETWRIGQGGGRPGANAWFASYPELGAALIILTNQDPPAGELMGDVLGNVIAGQPCRPVTAAERPGPLRLLPPPGRSGGEPGAR